MVMFEKEQEQRHHGNMIPQGIVFWSLSNWSKMVMITGEIFAHMMFECICHQVTIVGGDANRLSYQKAGKQLNGSYIAC